MKERIQILQLEQLHGQRDRDLIGHERQEMFKFLKFLAKVNNKLRKHVLNLPATKVKRHSNVVSDQHELKFQLKVLVDRLLASHY